MHSSNAPHGTAFLPCLPATIVGQPLVVHNQRSLDPCYCLLYRSIAAHNNVVAAASQPRSPTIIQRLLLLLPLVLPSRPCHPCYRIFLPRCSLASCCPYLSPLPFSSIAASPAAALTAANHLCPPLADVDNLVAVKSYYIYDICP
ncbi:hypothetical protein GW17_00061369 [Ensete ventricosum]|nr:hypothetical protein GW17_00061369 [Ensete ventricosum]